MHDDFGISRPGKMVIIIGQQLVAQLRIIGELPVESKAEPLVFLQVVAFERLGIVQVIVAACRVTHVTNRGPASHSSHDTLSLAMMSEVENFAHGAYASECVEELLPIG